MQQPGILLVNLSGLYTPSDSTKLIACMKQNVFWKNCKSIMIDCKKAQIVFKTTELYYRPSLYEMMGLARDCKTAILVSSIKEDSMFYENVCNNRGFNFKLFVNKELAEKWLLD